MENNTTTNILSITPIHILNHSLKNILYKGYFRNKSIDNNLYDLKISDNQSVQGIFFTFNPKIEEKNYNDITVYYYKLFLIEDLNIDNLLIKRNNYVYNGFKYWINSILYFSNNNLNITKIKLNEYISYPSKLHDINSINKLYIFLFKLINEAYKFELNYQHIDTNNISEKELFDIKFINDVNDTLFLNLREFFNL